ncbi:hypothetical protein, partial [Fusicatenibacter saccharivorans]|uniref:hypothetical protein n=1 Tax=Fusicatenibacter saccharivorans TaxID=1150298 RepID=UPI003F8F435C
QHKLLFFQYVCFIQFSMTHRKKGANFMLKNEVFGRSVGGAELSFLNSDEKLSTEDAWENRYRADSKDDLK